MRPRSLTAFGLAAAVLGALAPAAGAVPVTDLGAWDGVGGFRPVAVAGSGSAHWVAGTKVIATSPDEFGHAARWSQANATLTDLLAIGGAGTNRSSGALDVNDAGLVVGVSNTANDFAGENAFKRGVADGAMVDLGVLDDTVFAPGATARGVNAQGYIVGSSMRAVNATEKDQGFRIIGAGALTLADTFPAADAGNDVYLFALQDGAQSAAVGARGWNPQTGTGGTGIHVDGLGAVRALSFVPGRHGLSADGKWAAGTSGSNLAQKADVSVQGAVTATTLGALAPATTSAASAVNKAGVVVGASGGKAVAWVGTTAIDLNGLLDEGSDWVLQSALDISEDGLVVGYGTKAGVRHGFVIQFTATSKITVNSTADKEDANQTPASARDGVCDSDLTKAGLQCTLRAAIQTANESDDKNEIVFDIPGGALPTIQPVGSALPAFTAPVSLDGRTQPGTPAGKPGVELDGSKAGGRANGLRVQGGKSEIRGLIINRFSYPGISAKANGDVKIQGNWIGLDRAGTGSAYVDAGNSSGIDIGTTGVTIGGPLPTDRNIISGNGNADSARKFFEYQSILNKSLDDLVKQPSTLQDVERQLGAGIVIHRATAGDVKIINNWIGVGPDGTRPSALTLDQTTPPAFGNLFGILIGPAREGGPQTGPITIGGPGGPNVDGNVISGNVIGIFAAPFVQGFSIGKLRIEGNRIGPDAQNNPLKDLSSIIGVMAAGEISALEIVRNDIQNVAVGVASFTPNLTMTQNTIGVDEPLVKLVESLKANDSSPVLGKHNLIGFIAAGGAAMRIGKPGEGNAVVGNLFQQGIAVMLPGARIEGNTFGSKRQISGTIGKAIGQFTGLGGLMVLGKGGVVSKNRVANTIGGLTAVFTPDFAFEENTLDGNVIGLHGMFTPRSSFRKNTFTRNAIGTFLFGIWPTDEELRRAGVDPAEFGEVAQKQLFTGITGGKTSDLARASSADSEVSADGKTFRAPLSPLTVEELLTSAKTTWYGNTWGSASDASLANIFPFWALGDIRQMKFGGTGAGEANTVARNLTGLWLGPAFAGHQPAGVELRGNTFLGSGKVGDDGTLVEAFQPGVDLLPQIGEGITDATQYFGVDPNDVGDGDTGPNGMQNHPLLVGVEDVAGSLRVRGVLPSKPGGRYTVDLYANHACVGSGRTGGSSAEKWLGEVVVQTDGFGNGVIDATVPKPAGWSGALLVSSMATSPQVDGFGETSEISDCVRLGDPAGAVIVNGAGDPTAGPDIFIVNGPGARVTPGPGDTVIGTGDGLIVTQPGGSPAPKAAFGGAATTGAGVHLSLKGKNVKVSLAGGADQVSIVGDGARIATGGGRDVVRVDGKAAKVDGGADGDSITIVGGGALATGGAGDDLLRVTGARARGVGGPGRDSVIATGAGATADGGAAVDVLIVKGAKAVALGGAGNDRLTGGAGTRLDGAAGNDTLTATGGAVRAIGGAGNDAVTITGASANVLAGAGNDRIAVTGAKAKVDAGAGNDRIEVAGGSANVLAGAGNDTILAKNRKKDRLDGGAGRDTATVDKVDVRKRVERVKK